MKNRNLKALRMKHGLTQDEMGTLLNMHGRTYARKENGVSDFTLEEVQMIVTRFNVSFNDIFLPDKFTKTHFEEGNTNAGS